MSQMTTPVRNSMTKNFAPTMLSSSQSRSALGAGGKACQSRESTRCSLAMSWAPGAIRPNGGPPQHQWQVPEPQQVGEVRRAVGELQYRQVAALQSRHPGPEERASTGPVQVLSRPDRRDVC